MVCAQKRRYADDDRSSDVSYLLCPSHTNSKKWPIDWEPMYNYRAAEIDRFGQSFHELMLKVSDLGAKLEAARIASIARSASDETR